MSTWAVIPIKPLRDSKRRLARVLSAEARAALIHRFLDNLLLVLSETEGVDHALIVTGDPAVIKLAKEHGTDIMIECDPYGLNLAVTRGVARAIDQGAAAVLILPTDLPYASVEDIEAMLRPLAEPNGDTMAICADEVEDGTNALLLAPPGNFTFHYGPGSFQAHLAEALELGRSIHIVDAPGLRFDLDTESDWLAYSGQWVATSD